MQQAHKVSEQTKQRLSATRIARIASGEIVPPTREAHPGWKGGRIFRDGYVYALRPDHPNSGKQGYIAEHRLVMEVVLGRYLEKSEVVHHINHDRQDNRPENLMIGGTNGTHVRDHHPEAGLRAAEISKGRRPPNYNRGLKICPFCGTEFETTLGVSGKVFCSRPCKAKSQTATLMQLETLKLGRRYWPRKS